MSVTAHNQGNFDAFTYWLNVVSQFPNTERRLLELLDPADSWSVTVLQPAFDRGDVSSMRRHVMQSTLSTYFA